MILASNDKPYSAQAVAGWEKISSELFLFTELLLVSDDDRDELIRVQILFGDTLHVRATDLADEIPVTVRIVETQLEIFNLREKARDSSVGIEPQREAADQVI